MGLLKFLLILMWVTVANAQSFSLPKAELGPAPEIQLVIVGVGDVEYSLAGHAALVAILDASAPLEEAVAFNFGATNFKRPNYVLDFIGGRVKFWGLKKPYGRSLKQWTRQDRDVTRYPLLLDETARRQLYARMLHDVEMEHREYTYDVFRENCATRIRGYLDTYSQGAVFGATHDKALKRSFRDDIRVVYSKRTTLLVPTEFVAGVDFDKHRTAWEMMYHPLALEDWLTQVQTGDGPLLGAPIVDHRRESPSSVNGSTQHGQYLILVLAFLLAALGWWIPQRGPRLRGGLLAASSLFMAGLGIVLLWIMGMTDWPDLQRNPLVFAMIPLDLGLLWTAGFQIFRREHARAPIARPYLVARLVVALILVALTPILGAIAGPLPPRILAVVLVWVNLRCLKTPNEWA